MGVFFAIGNFLAKLFGKNADFLLGIINRRTALTVGTLAIIVGMMLTLYTAVTAILQGLTYAMPTEVSTALSWFVPSNFNELMTAYIAFRVALALYKWKGYQFKFMAKGF